MHQNQHRTFKIYGAKFEKMIKLIDIFQFKD